MLRREMPRRGLVVEAVVADVSIPRAIVVVGRCTTSMSPSLSGRLSTEEAREELTMEHRD